MPPPRISTRLPLPEPGARSGFSIFGVSVRDMPMAWEAPRATAQPPVAARCSRIWRRLVRIGDVPLELQAGLSRGFGGLGKRNLPAPCNRRGSCLVPASNGARTIHETHRRRPAGGHPGAEWPGDDL